MDHEAFVAQDVATKVTWDWQKTASVLFTIGDAVMNPLVFSGNNFFLRKYVDHCEKERKRHELVLEKLQKSRDEWNKDRVKCSILSIKDSMKMLKQEHTSTISTKQC